MTTEQVDVLEAFDQIEPIGVRAIARPLAAVVALLARYMGDKEASLLDFWPEQEKKSQGVQEVTPDQAAMMFRAAYGC